MQKEDRIPSRCGQVEERLMKPFASGWTREVVRRTLTKNPTCDVYYFSPRGKKIRSLNELKSHLTDGLSLDCFSFKREILGVEKKFESVRDAYHRKKDNKPGPRKRKVETKQEVEEPQPGPSGVQPKRKKPSVKKDDADEEGDELKRNNEDQETAGASKITKKTRRNPLAKVPLSTIEREIVRRVIRKKMQKNRILARKKMLRESTWTIEEENVTADKDAIDQKLTEVQSDELPLEAEENSVQNSPALAEGKSREEGEGMEKGNEEEGAKDLKSIVQKNIGKYRRLREKQKLRLVKARMKKYSTRKVNNSRAESFLKNKKNYLKPLQKGWRRELVYRSNCSKAGIQADVYYFHPNGKKFRSSREISENPSMIGGLSIEFFTFRKEAVGCGEPQEIIRNARIPQKH